MEIKFIESIRFPGIVMVKVSNHFTQGWNFAEQVLNKGKRERPEDAGICKTVLAMLVHTKHC